ncbi:hypothetical protein ONZ45_g5157 [Pleurotus djamor]|nr:hypothetical protein ONZ45_g18913 [Pleurotus djamor]KAJ8517692.1 hypothetical protein ONZ45_g5157 [Pleurotus djamor]
MFNLVRRISRSLIPRPDRPWEEDPTSNAPQIGRKRRLSTTEFGGGPIEEERLTKRGKGELAAVTGASESDTRENSPNLASSSSPVEQEDVKEVTEGVKEVELEDKSVAPRVAPESVPLPDEEESGELDDAAAPVAGEALDAPVKASDDKDDVASSRSSSVQPQAPEERSNTVEPLSTSAPDAPAELPEVVAKDLPITTDTKETSEAPVATLEQPQPAPIASS